MPSYVPGPNPDSGGGKTSDVCAIVAIILWGFAILSMFK